jgi:hypothetical protein
MNIEGYDVRISIAKHRRTGNSFPTPVFNLIPFAWFGYAYRIQYGAGLKGDAQGALRIYVTHFLSPSRRSQFLTVQLNPSLYVFLNRRAPIRDGLPPLAARLFSLLDSALGRARGILCFLAAARPAESEDDLK